MQETGSDAQENTGQSLAPPQQFRSELQSCVNAVRLLIDTGCRLSEILGLKWEYVDLDRKRLNLPDGKTGAKVIACVADFALVDH